MAPFVPDYRCGAVPELAMSRTGFPFKPAATAGTTDACKYDRGAAGVNDNMMEVWLS